MSLPETTGNIYFSQEERDGKWLLNIWEDENLIKAIESDSMFEVLPSGQMIATSEQAWSLIETRPYLKDVKVSKDMAIIDESSMRTQDAGETLATLSLDNDTISLPWAKLLAPGETFSFVACIDGSAARFVYTNVGDESFLRKFEVINNVMNCTAMYKLHGDIELNEDGLLHGKTSNFGLTVTGLELVIVLK
ncbi:MAG: hypothetical protein ABIM99_00960 [Candidatus Dojkabacteria bacterium]